MFFLGLDFLGDSPSSVIIPVNVDSVESVNATGGWYDTVYMTRSTEDFPSSRIPTTWDEDTVLYADFDGTTSAGNLNWSAKNTNPILIKRRRKDSASGANDWITIHQHNVEEGGEFNFVYIDFTNQANVDYEYALVPVMGNTEGEYSVESIRSEMNMKIFIMEDGAYWNTYVTDDALNTTRNISKSYHTILHRRYPVSVSSATVNYDSGESSGEWYPFDEENCEVILDDPVRVRYQKEFMDFLTNYKPKILKSFDGRIWLVDVNPSPTDNMREIYFLREVGFSWTEIGNYESENDLYRSGLINVEPAYWSNVDTGFV